MVVGMECKFHGTEMNLQKSVEKVVARLSGKDEMLSKIQKQLGLLNLLLAKVERL